jgi:hypothetical protein
MQIKINEFESIGQEYAQILKKKMEIETIDDFGKYSIDEINKKTNIDIVRLQKWTDTLDLFQIPGVSAHEAELLYYANINSVKELSHRQAIRIFYKLREIDLETYFIILQLPTFAKIENWIYFAKLMTKRIKFGQNIPLIMLPMIKIDNASELKKYKIYTVEDFVQKSQIISKLRKRINMSRDEYQLLLNMIDFIKIQGVDLYFAIVIAEAGIETVTDFSTMNEAEILKQVENIQGKDPDCLEKMTLMHIQEIKHKIAEGI